MTTRKILIAQRLVLTGALCLSLWTVKSAWGQPAESVDLQRLERRVEALDRGSNRSALDIEKRFSAFEARQAVIDSKLDLVLKVGGVISVSVLGLIIQALWGGIVRKDAPSRRRKDTAE